MEALRCFKLKINDRAFNAIKAGKKNVEIRVTTDKQKQDYGNIKSYDIIIFINSTAEKLKCLVTDNIWYKNEKELLMQEGTKYTLSSTNDFDEGIRSINSYNNYTKGINENGIYAIHICPLFSNTYDMKLTKDNYLSIINGTKRVELRLNDEKRKLLKINDIIRFHLLDDDNQFFEVKIIGLSNYKTIKDLIYDFKMKYLLSKDMNANELINMFNNIYSKEKQKKYGILGISFKLIK